MLPRQTRYAYSPITRRPDYRWPGGKRLAVYLALGIEEYIFGEGMTEDLFPGASKPDYANVSWRDYGNRVGGFRLIERARREAFRSRSCSIPRSTSTRRIWCNSPGAMAARSWRMG